MTAFFFFFKRYCHVFMWKVFHLHILLCHIIALTFPGCHKRNGFILHMPFISVVSIMTRWNTETRGGSCSCGFMVVDRIQQVLLNCLGLTHPSDCGYFMAVWIHLKSFLPNIKLQSFSGIYNTTASVIRPASPCSGFQILGYVPTKHTVFLRILQLIMNGMK